MAMAALVQVSNRGHGRNDDDHWGRGKPPRGNDDEEGLVEEWGGKSEGRDWNMMRKRPRSPSTTMATTTAGAQGQIAHNRNKSELTVISSQWRRNSDTTTSRATPGDYPQRIHGTKISHPSSGPAATGTRSTSGQGQETTLTMCQNFVGRRESESATARGLQVPSRQDSPNRCNEWDRRLRSPDRGRNTAIPPRALEPTQRDRNIASHPPNASFERRLLDNDRSRTGGSFQHRREETTGTNRGHHFRSGGSWNDNRFNVTRNDSTPHGEPRQDYGGPNNRNASENHNSPPIRHEKGRAREETPRRTVEEWRHPNDSQQPRPFHAADDRYAQRRDGLEPPSAASRDFHNSSYPQFTASRRDLEQGRFPERRTQDILDHRRVPPTRNDNSWQHPEGRTSRGSVDTLPSQYQDKRFDRESNFNSKRCQSISDADSSGYPGRDSRTFNTTNASPQARPPPVPCHRHETNSGAWQSDQDLETWRSTDSSVRDFPYSNPSSKSSQDRRQYDETQGGRSTRGPNPGRFSETQTTSTTNSSSSPGRDQWHRQKRQNCQAQGDRDTRQHLESTDKPFVSNKPFRGQGRDQWHRQQRQTFQAERDHDPRQRLDSTDKPFGSINPLRGPGRDQCDRQEGQPFQLRGDLDSKQNSEKFSYTSANPLRSGPNKFYHQDNDSCETSEPRSNPSRNGSEPMPQMRHQVSPAVLTTSYASTPTSTSPSIHTKWPPPTSNADRGNPAAHGNLLDSRSCSHEANYKPPTKSQHDDRFCQSRKREATDSQNLNAPNKRWCNVTRDLANPAIQSLPSSTADAPNHGVTSQEKSNKVAPLSNLATTGLSQATTTDVISKNSVTSTTESSSIKKTSIGIPMRWLKPQKPKIVQKAKSKEHSSLAKNVNEPKKEEPAPSSPLINRMVTDSEGGSTVSNTRELLAMMERKTKQPKVPTAIVTMQTVEDTSLDSPPRADFASKISNQRNVNAGTKTAASLDKTDTDDEPPLESDDDDDSSIESSSDESDTDDEEVMLWASKMFGVPLPSTTPQGSLASTNEMNREGKPTMSKKPLKLRLKLSASKILPGTPSSSALNRQNDLMVDQRTSLKETKVLQPELSSEHTDEPLMHAPMRLAVRGRRKKKKSLLKKLPDISPEELQVDLEQERIEREEEKRIREEAKPLTAVQIREILGEDAFDEASSSNWVRRSVRQPSRALLNSKPLKALVEGLKNNDPDMVVLKMKKYINDPNAPSVVLDAALEALEENTNCQALYIQNFNEGMRDKQVLHLLRILQSSTCKIWCLNIGENYYVDTDTWDTFTRGLRRTKITHMYASEHTITTEMKDEIRETIRENRSKHDMHINPNNLEVIIQCTHCWWNPVNAKALRPYLKKKGYEHILNDKEAQGLRGSTSEAPSA